MGLAAALDISVASRDAKFGFSEVRVGVAPAMISVICLPKMRLGDARSTFLRGGRFTADEAVRLGLITTAVDPEDLDDEVDAVVADLLEGAPGAIAATKELLATVPSMAADQAFAWTKELSARLFSSEEARQGMTAFLEKRPPPWSPRAH
jgi:methylglutaconyl-CoA hydratase